MNPDVLGRLARAYTGQAADHILTLLRLCPHAYRRQYVRSLRVLMASLGDLGECDLDDEAAIRRAVSSSLHDLVTLLRTIRSGAGPQPSQAQPSEGD